MSDKKRQSEMSIERHLSEVFLVKDCIGRVWEISAAAVREDYIHFLVDADGLDEREAHATADSKEGVATWGINGYWFAEQIADSPLHVMSIGKLISDISPEAKQEIVESAARRLPVKILIE